MSARAEAFAEAWSLMQCAVQRIEAAVVAGVVLFALGLALAVIAWTAGSTR